MIHYMTLNPTPFDNIQNGIKTIELRLNDNKRKLIKINDTIVFHHKDNHKKSITAKVIRLYHFSSFNELYCTLPLLKCGYTEDNIKTAKPEDMREYYTKEQEDKFGVLGIEFQLINNDLAYYSDLKNTEIRIMTISDYSEVYALWLSCTGMGLNSLDDSKDGIEKFLNRNPDTCFVAVANGKIAGAILAGNDGRRGYIYHTAVLPEYQKQGIGSQLVNTAVNALKNAGIHKTALVVFSKNSSGNTFWEKQGFTKRNDLVYRNKTIHKFERIDT